MWFAPASIAISRRSRGRGKILWPVLGGWFRVSPWFDNHVPCSMLHGLSDLISSVSNGFTIIASTWLLGGVSC